MNTITEQKNAEAEKVAEVRRTDEAEATPLADCVLCGEPTEYPASTKGATLCPVCEWQEAQRMACSG